MPRTGARTSRSPAEGRGAALRSGRGPEPAGASAMMPRSWSEAPDWRFPVIRRFVVAGFVVAGFLLAVASEARAASKEIERLQIQIAGLQNQIAELQRSSEDTHREVRRLNEMLAEQNATTKKTLTDQRVQEEAIASALKDISDRLAEVTTVFDVQFTSAPYWLRLLVGIALVAIWVWITHLVKKIGNESPEKAALQGLEPGQESVHSNLTRRIWLH